MGTKPNEFRIHTFHTLVDAELYDFATAFFDKTRVKVCASGSQLRLIRAAALIARGMAERGGVCLVVLPSLLSNAAIHLRDLFADFNLKQADWEYKATQETPPAAAVVLTSQKTLRKVLLKKGRVRLPFNSLLFLGLETNLFTEDWFDINLIKIRLKEMRALPRIPHYLLVKKYVTDVVGWLESLELEVATVLDDAYPLPQEAMRVSPKQVEQFFRQAFRAGKHNFVLRLTRKWRSKKILLRALRWSFPYFLATEGRRAWLERETLQLLEHGIKLNLVYRRSYRYRYEPKKEARVARDIVALEPGRVIKVLVNEGEFVERGQEVLVVETPTRELRLRTPGVGQVTRLYCTEGTEVPPERVLLDLERWQLSGMYHCTPNTAYLATYDFDFAVTEALAVWLASERAHREAGWKPLQKELEEKLVEFAADRGSWEQSDAVPEAEQQVDDVFAPRPRPAPTLVLYGGGYNVRRMETVSQVVHAEGAVDQKTIARVVETMGQVVRGETTMTPRKPPRMPMEQVQEQLQVQELCKSPEGEQLKTPKKKKPWTPIDLAAYGAARLSGRVDSEGEDFLTKDALASVLNVHYSTFVKELSKEKIPTYRVYYAITKYFGTMRDDTVLTEQDKKRVDFEYRDELVAMQAQFALTMQRVGLGRPRLMLCFLGASVAHQEVPSFFGEAKCKECGFFTPQERTCQLWFAAAREGVTRRTTAARARRGRVFPELTACLRFRPKERVEVPAGLVSIKLVPQGDDLVEVLTCYICGEDLPRGPLVVRTEECPRCGTPYRQSPTGDLQMAPNVADALERELRLLCGYEPPRRPQEFQLLQIYVAATNRWHMTADQLQVEYPGITETYALAEVEHVTCHDERLTQQLRERGIRVTLKPLDPAVQLPLKLNLAKAMRWERAKKDLLPLFVLALVFSARFHTERVREAIDKVRALGAEWETVAARFERELEDIFAYQEFEILRCLWGGQVTPGYLRGLEGRVYREVEGLFRNILTEVLQDERVVYPGAGRRWGKHAEATVDIVLRVAAAKTMFDSARNYVNRQLRSQLRKLSAEEGFGWHSAALFLHTPTDKPGRSVHLDLEELARMEARLEVVLAFLEGKLAAKHGAQPREAIKLGPEDFAESYYLGMYPRYAPKPEATAKLKKLAGQVLERTYWYGGEWCPLQDAHVQHVRSLKQALLSTGKEPYIPLMCFGAMSEEQWAAFQQRFGEFGRRLVQGNPEFKTALEGILTQITTWRRNHAQTAYAGDGEAAPS